MVLNLYIFLNETKSIISSYKVNFETISWFLKKLKICIVLAK